MKKLVLILDQTNWLEATWTEEITTEVQVEKEGEIVTEEKTEIKIIHCESYSGHPEHISMLRARALEFETPLDVYEDLIQKAKAGFVMPSQEELYKLEAEQERIQAKAIKQELLANIKVTTSNSNIFDGNEVARSNMVSAIIASDILGIPKTTWKLADNSVAEITLDELKEALALSIQEVGRIVIGE